MPPETTTDDPEPASRELFLTFLRIGLAGFGGVLPHARHALIERKGWLNDRQFTELLSLGQVLPGPNIVNMALMLGHRYRGLPGALATVTGLMFAPMVIVLLLAMFYGRFADNLLVQRVMAGVAFAGAGLILSTGLRMVMSQSRRVAVWSLVAATVGAKVLLGVPLMQVLLALALAGLGCVWKRWL